MPRKKIYINLTNGIEALDGYGIGPGEVSFIRIQSSHCESHKYDLILMEIDHNFLMHLALGYECVVYDFGANADKPKAVYHGLEWIRFVLNKRWLDKTDIPVVKDKIVTQHFEREYKKIDKRTKKRLDYYKKYLFTDEIKITGVTGPTVHDNDPDFYREILERNYSINNKREK